MLDVVFFGLTGAHWLLLGLAAAAGAGGGWLAVMLLLHPVRPTGIPGLLPVQGFVSGKADALAAFAVGHLLQDLPAPRRFFEQLGPDRFRREFGRVLRDGIDAHVDDVMTRRNGPSWEALSTYARARIYAHVHRRLPYVVDDFVDHVQRELDDIVHPSLLVRRWFSEHPERVADIFLRVYGRDLRNAIPWSVLVAVAVAFPVPLLLQGSMAWAVAGALAGAAAAFTMLVLLSRPVALAGIWPLRWQGIVHRRRQRFLQAISRMVVHDALGWRAINGEFLRGAHAGRVRHMMRREVAAILDVPLFRASMQLLLGPEGFAEVKSSAVEKAVEMLASAPVSPALREHYRQELERTLAPAIFRVPEEEWAALWREVLAGAWKYVPLSAGIAGLLVGALVGALVG